MSSLGVTDLPAVARRHVAERLWIEMALTRLRGPYLHEVTGRRAGRDVPKVCRMRKAKSCAFLSNREM
jgi:hypothetical protein